jgi:hypothetical protein
LINVSPLKKVETHKANDRSLADNIRTEIDTDVAMVLLQSLSIRRRLVGEH